MEAWPMGPFLPLSALLVALAVAIATRPLWRQSRGAALALLALVPALVAGLYAYKGRPEALDAAAIRPVETIEQAEAELVQRLARQPDDFEAWALLGRMRMGLGKFAKAAEAYAQARSLAPDEPNVMVELAEAQMRASDDRRFPPEAVELLEKAVASNPGNQRGLFFLGVHRLQSGDPAGASRTWERLLPLMDARTAAALRPQIDAARAQAGLPPLPADAATPSLRVKVDIDPALQAQVPAKAVLFVFARAENGQGPPVAAKRIEAPAFPLELTLTDQDSVMPTHKLSSQARVQVQARLSANGSAMPSRGDIESAPASAGLDAELDLRLSELRP